MNSLLQKFDGTTTVHVVIGVVVGLFLYHFLFQR